MNGSGPAELDDLRRARPGPIVLQHRIGNKPGPDRKHGCEEEPLRQSKPEEMSPRCNRKHDARRRGKTRRPGQRGKQRAEIVAEP